MEYEVQHPPWRVRDAVEGRFVADIADLYGADFRDTLERPADSVFVAEGSAVSVAPGRRLTEAEMS